jgi:hypothetical protein
MDDPNFTIDDLHEDEPVESPKPESAEPPKPDPEPAPAADPPPADPPSGDPAPDDPPADDPTPASGMELFLSQYDIEAGMITYDDGTSAHISELTPDEQAQILSSVANDARPSIEDQYDLEQTEINLLNELRNSKKSVEEYIDDLAQTRFASLKADSDSREVNYVDMADDAVYVKFLREKNAEITEEEIESGLTAAKENPTYKTLVEGLRDNFIFKQDKAKAEADKIASEKDTRELESDRKTIVDAASKINDIGGWEIPREVKNDVLHDLLEVNEYGDSLFLENTFSNPETMFKAAWFSKYGENYLTDVENFYKKEITKAFKRGQTSVTEGLPTKPISISGSTTNMKNELHDPDTESGMDVDDLHNMN